MIEVKPEYIGQIEKCFENKIVSVITDEFDDLDLKRYYDSKYKVITLTEAMKWDDFLNWFSAKANFSGLFVTEDTKPRLFIICTDLISQVPSAKKKKTTKKSTRKRKATVPVESFINYVRFKQRAVVILTSECSLKDYKFVIKPILIGELAHYSDLAWCATQIVYGTNLEIKQKIIDFHYNDTSFFNRIIPLLSAHFVKNPEQFFSFYEAIKVYYGARYEFPHENMRSTMLNLLQCKNMKDIVIYPKYYNLFFNKEIDINEL